MKLTWVLIAVAALSFVGVTAHSTHKLPESQLLTESGKKDEKKEDEDKFALAEVIEFRTVRGDV